MEWVLAHMGDADFNDPLPEQGQGANSGGGAQIEKLIEEALSRGLVPYPAGTLTVV